MEAGSALLRPALILFFRIPCFDRISRSFLSCFVLEYDSNASVDIKLETSLS